MFARFRQQAGVSEEAITPQILRHSFALRYLQAGGNPQGLQELMGYEGMAPIRHYLRWHDQLLHEQMRNLEATASSTFLPHDDHPLVLGSTLVCCLVKDHESA